MNNIYLIVGESGSGKTTIVNELCRRYNLKTIDSYTTRPQRYIGETGHTFVTESEFDKLQDICAYVKYNGYRYCATSKQVDEADLYVIDPKGIQYFLKHYNGKKLPLVIYIKCSSWIRFKRMLNRGDGLLQSIKRIIVDIKQFANLYKEADLTIDGEKDKESLVRLVKSFINEEEYYCDNGNEIV